MSVPLSVPPSGTSDLVVARWWSRARARARDLGVGPARRVWCSLAVLGALLLVAEVAAAQVGSVPASSVSLAGVDGPAAVEPVDVEAGEAALKAASRAKSAAYKVEGEARTAALLDVAREYGAVADTVRFGVDARAEAAFRAGELLRARSRPEEALARFGQATSLGEAAEAGSPARSFAARGLVEQAHALRRSDEIEAALGLYAQLDRRFPEQLKSRVHARSWTVKLLVRAGRLEEALPHVNEFATQHPDRPVEAVKAATELAEALVEAGRADEASALATAVENQVVPGDSGEPVAERLTSALDALRVTVSQSGY